MSSMSDILRAIDSANTPVAECPPEMGQQAPMGQEAPTLNIQLSDADQMSQLIQALQSVQQGGQGEAIEEGGTKAVIDMVANAENPTQMVMDLIAKGGPEGQFLYGELEQLAVERGQTFNDGETDPEELVPELLANMGIEEDYENEPDEEYMDIDSVLRHGDDLHKSKKSYPATAGGDNPMNVESIKDRLYAALTEKKAKPDFLDVDKDGDKKEPMKKALKDKGSKPKKGKVPPQFKKKGTDEGVATKDCPKCGAPGKKKLMACSSCGCS